MSPVHVLQMSLVQVLQNESSPCFTNESSPGFTSPVQSSFYNMPCFQFPWRICSRDVKRKTGIKQGDWLAVRTFSLTNHVIRLVFDHVSREEIRPVENRLNALLCRS